MNYSGWPDPPIADSEEPPAVPQRYSMFGTVYRVVDGNPEVDIPHEQLNKEEIKRLVNRSFDVFVKLVETLEPSCLTELGDLHSVINEKINKAKALKGDETINMAKTLTIERKKAVLSELKRLMSVRTGTSQ